jgi:hypothetical protein
MSNGLQVINRAVYGRQSTAGSGSIERRISKQQRDIHVDAQLAEEVITLLVV